jgi:hypothetical protein
MGVGASADAYVGVEYDYLSSSSYGFTFPTDASLSYTPPFLSYTSFAINSLTLTVELTATQDFSLEYEWLYVDWLGASFTLQLSGTAEYAYENAAAVSFLSISASKATSIPANAQSHTVVVAVRIIDYVQKSVHRAKLIPCPT